MLNAIYLKIEKVSYILAVVIEKLIGIALIIIFVLIFAEVIGRLYFSYTIVWMMEATGFLLAIIVFFGMSVVIYRKELLSVDFVKEKLLRSLKSKTYFNIFVWLIVAIYSYILIKEGLVFAIRGIGRFTPTRLFEFYHIRMILPVGGMMIFVQAICNIVKEILVLLIASRTGIKAQQPEEDVLIVNNDV